jgi:hypothetical protein
VKRLRFAIALRLKSRLMPLIVRDRPLDAVLAAAEPASARTYRGLAPEYVIDHVERATRHPWFMRDRRCLRQGLLAYHFLAAAGYRPALHFGVDRASITSVRLRAHCWVVLAGAVILNPPDGTTQTIFVYDGPRPNGARQNAPMLAVGDRTAA